MRVFFTISPTHFPNNQANVPNFHKVWIHVKEHKNCIRNRCQKCPSILGDRLQRKPTYCYYTNIDFIFSLFHLLWRVIMRDWVGMTLVAYLFASTVFTFWPLPAAWLNIQSASKPLKGFLLSGLRILIYTSHQTWDRLSTSKPGLICIGFLLSSL